MTVKELIEELKERDPDQIVVIGEPEGSGWANIEKIRGHYFQGSIYLIPEQHPIFSGN